MIDYEKVLNLKTSENAAALPANTKLRDIFAEFLCELIVTTDSFSGKRPLGNSDWWYELAKPLVKEGIVDGKINEWGDACDYFSKEIDDVLVGAIKHMCSK
jgi:hypothetical protein